MLMKKRLLSILIGLFGLNLPAQTADQDVANGLTNYLVAHELVLANQQFTNALVLSPTNAAANALTAITRLLLLPTSPAGSNFLTSLGYATAGRNIYNWTSSLPVDASGDQVLPSLNTAAMIAFYRTNVMAALAASRTNLARITDPTFTLALTAAETSLQAVTLDYGDVLLLQALERAAEFAGYTANAQNGDVVLSQLQALSKTNGLTIQRVLALYPSLLLLASPNDLTASEGAFTNAAALYFAASDFIRHVRPLGAPALFVLSDDKTNEEASFRTQLTNVLASLNGPVAFSTSLTLNASNYFAGTKTLRSLLPQFHGDTYVPDTLPDYTFGGILVDQPAFRIEKQLRHLFYSYAGIYNGDGGISDNNSGGLGDFTVFVGTNQQATLVGTDYGDGLDDGTDFGIFLQFSVDQGGNWQVTNSNFSASGGIGKDGSFWGALDYINGYTVYFNSYYEESPLGPFQNAAGYYSGTIKGSTDTELFAVLAADGEINFCPALANGTPDTGGLAQFDANNHFATNLISATTIAGTLTPSALIINGTWTNSHTGTWTLTRAANVAFDVPPAITKDLPTAVAAQVGTNLAVSLAATGSPPMCFQWYSNGIALPFATTNSLVLSNLQFSSAGTYSVVIDNVAGEANSAFTLSVLCSTAPPTNQITAPTPGQHWSNALFTVTGKAEGKAAVTNVFYSLNQGAWSNAAPVNNWSNWVAQETLVPGTNTVAAYAVDSCGNLSVTNVVNLVYVASAVLTVNVGTGGTVTPNDNGALLQLGQNYTLTAVTNVGFAFAGWTGSVTTNSAVLTFQMASNLVFNAHFVDTAKPTNQITAPIAGQHWSNAVFTVTGRAGDNVAVSNVLYSLNNTGWSNAAPVNNWSNWTAQVTLTPGTNLVAAYALDTSGNVSATNTATIVYVLSGVLTVNVGAGGTVTPNDNGALLQIGQNYTLTAVTNVGFAFAGWSGSLATNSSVLTFQMASNLVLNANFADTQKPTNQITAPIAGQHWSNAVFTVTGRAGDNVAVSNVLYSLNNTGWSNAAPVNNWSNWTAQVMLSPGTNTLAAYALDTSGNVSSTNSVTFTYVVSASLTVQLAGKGTVSPNYSNATLQVGATYTLTASAVAGSGFAFTNWTGGTNLALMWLTNGSTVKFTMASNLVLQANFTDTNPPMLAFTNVTDNNGTLVVSGRNNETVAQIFGQLNGAAWLTGLVNSNSETWTWMTSMTNVVAGTNQFYY